MPSTTLINSPMFSWLLGYEAKRKLLLKKAPAGVLHDFLSVPLPNINTPIDKVAILAVDFETTGLNAKQDKLLSVGYITLQQQQISLKSSYHQIIKSKAQLEESNVIIHHITDSQKEQGQALATVVASLLQALAGKVMLVHFARIEKQFLTEACYELYGMAPSFPMIDTLALAKRRLDKRDVAYDPSELRLASLRHKIQLPEHHGHNALNDAIATAELFMAQMSKVNKDGKITLKDVLL
ncbi:exonuclease domain-containing protein [Colwellia sp. TT2012]|uniref:exonuclease domain-containing protein n=1 Tax=Colwellia sp. TT2012 TaxID=1720342 RepID=UPI000AD27193|nr:exonuclease domain-containing protein [Colwellia sp. TT2012]